MIKSYAVLTIPQVGIPTIKVIELKEDISIPANAEQLPYGQEISLPVGKYNLFHKPDCTWYTRIEE